MTDNLITASVQWCNPELKDDWILNVNFNTGEIFLAFCNTYGCHRVLNFPGVAWKKVNFPDKSRSIIIDNESSRCLFIKNAIAKMAVNWKFFPYSVLIRINQCCKKFKISLTFLQKYRFSLTQKTISWLFPDLEEFFSLTTSRPVMSGFLKITGTANVCTERLHYLLFHQRFLDHPDLRGDRGDRNLRLRRQHREIPSLPGRPEIWATPNRSVLEKPY